MVVGYFTIMAPNMFLCVRDSNSFFSNFDKIQKMKDYIEFFKNCCMWATILFVAVSVVEFFIELAVKTMYVIFCQPGRAAGLLVLSAFVFIGICQIIDKFRENK
jgi:hypothetical protein|tara:strand:- start:3022 stop:3333 length:312 start_codon:yes stop_codon:yes gene_type:complete